MKRGCEALRPGVTHLVGREGFRALLSRALTLAKRDQVWLIPVEVNAAGELTGLDEALAGRERAEEEPGGAAVLAHLLTFLADLVGSELTRQLVNSAWPDIPVTNADFGIEEDEA